MYCYPVKVPVNHAPVYNVQTDRKSAGWNASVNNLILSFENRVIRRNVVFSRQSKGLYLSYENMLGNFVSNNEVTHESK